MILAASSPYFEAMFTHDFTENRADRGNEPIALKGVSAEGLEAILSCIYTAKLEIDEENLEDILGAAHHLQFSSIVSKCSTYIVQSTTNTNCLNHVRLAEKFNLGTAKAKADDYLLKNFVEVSNQDDFMFVSLDALCGYLGHDGLTREEEIDVFRAACRWLEHDTDRLPHTTSIMKHIRFGFMTTEQLTTEVILKEFMKENHTCFNIFIDAITYHSNVFSQPTFTGEMNRPRGTSILNILQASDTSNGSIEQIQCMFEDAQKSYRIDTITVNTRDVFAAVPVGNYLFVFGMEYTSNSNFTMRYSANSNTWMQLAPLLQPPRIGIAAAYASDQIFLMGGRDLGFRETTSLCDRYIIKENKWDVTQNMPYQVHKASACGHSGAPCIAGGNTSPITVSATNKFFMYDQDSDIWCEMTRMSNSKADFQLVSCNDKIYAIGGHDTLNPEMYDPHVNQWTDLSVTDLTYKLSFERSVKTVVKDNMIFCIFGKEILRYDTVHHVWELEQKELPTPLDKNAFVCLLRAQHLK